MLDHFFENYLKIEKAYRRFFQSEMEDYGLTPNELLVILFLAKRDKTLNTARDIAQHEGVSKGLVARSVEDLLAKGYLEVERDEVDRRICHLYLTPSCDNIIARITEKKQDFFKRLVKDIPEGDVLTTERTLLRFMENITSV